MWNTIPTQLTSWVTTAIIQQDTVQGRAATIELFIKVASECLKQNDAQSCVLITCALNSCCVRHDRLKLSWEQVSSKVIGYIINYIRMIIYIHSYWWCHFTDIKETPAWWEDIKITHDSVYFHERIKCCGVLFAINMRVCCKHGHYFPYHWFNSSNELWSYSYSGVFCY